MLRVIPLPLPLKNSTNCPDYAGDSFNFPAIPGNYKG